MSKLGAGGRREVERDEGEGEKGRGKQARSGEPKREE